MSISQEEKLVFASAYTANAVKGAVDTVVTEGCSRVIRSMASEYDFVVVPENYDWREDPDDIVEKMCGPDDAYAAAPSLSAETVDLIAQAMFVPAATMAGAVIEGWDLSGRMPSPEAVMSDIEAYGKVTGKLVALRLMGMDSKERMRNAIFGDDSPIGPKSGKAFPAGEEELEQIYALVVPLIGQVIPGPGKLSFNADDGGICIRDAELLRKKDAPAMA